MLSWRPLGMRAGRRQVPQRFSVRYATPAFALTASPPKKLNSSALITSACVVGSPWGPPGITFRFPILHKFYAQPRCIINWDDLIGIAVNHERGDIDLFEIFRLIRFRESLNAVVRCNDRALHSKQPNASRTPSEIFAPGLL